jgi:hypothetical protein
VLNKFTLPKSLTHLDLGYSFNQVLNKFTLPNNLLLFRVNSTYSSLLKKELSTRVRVEYY